MRREQSIVPPLLQGSRCSARPHASTVAILVVAALGVLSGVDRAYSADSAPTVIQLNAEVLRAPVDTVLSPDGKIILASWGDGTILRWNVSTGKLMPTDGFTIDQPLMKGRIADLWFKNCRVLSSAFSVSGTTKLSGRSIASVALATGKIKSVPFEFGKPFRFSTADVSPDGSRYAIAADVVYVVNAASGKTLRKLVPEAGAGAAPANSSNSSSVLGLAFSRDSKQLAAIVSSGEITVWNAASGKVTAVLPGQPLIGRQPPFDLVWFDDNTLLTPNSITGGKLQRWNIDTQKAVDVTWTGGVPANPPAGAKQKKRPGPGSANAPAAGGQGIAGWDGTTRHFNGIIDFSPDGKRAVYAVGEKRSEGRDNDGRLVVVDLPAGRAIGAIPLEPDNVFAAQFSRDSQSLLVGSRWGWYDIFRVIPMAQVEKMAQERKPLSSVDSALEENPEVASWSRYKEGDHVQHDVTVTRNGRTVSGIVTHNLRKVHADRSGIEVADSCGYEITSVAEPTIIPLSRIRTILGRLAVDTPKPTLNPMLGRIEGKTTAQGKETLKVGGGSYDCEIFKFDGLRFDTDGNAYPITGKYWSCPDVPGLVVKSTSVSKLQSELRVEMTLKQIVRK
jgi:WD40 repeat protein